MSQIGRKGARRLPQLSPHTAKPIPGHAPLSTIEDDPGRAPVLASDKTAVTYDTDSYEIKELLRRIWQLENGNNNSGPGTVTSITATTPIVVTPSPIVASGVVSHADSGVTATTYGDASNWPVITVNAKGHITSATTQAASAGSGSTGFFWALTLGGN